MSYLGYYSFPDNLVLLLLIAVVLLPCVIGLWNIFKKTGEPGWKSVIPIYNLFILLRIVGLSPWWVILIFIPYMNALFIFIVDHFLAQRFSKKTGFTLGLMLLPMIFYPILGFDNSVYRKNA